MKAAKKRKKKKTYRLENCGGKKCGSAFEWKVIDLAPQVSCKKAA